VRFGREVEGDPDPGAHRDAVARRRSKSPAPDGGDGRLVKLRPAGLCDGHLAHGSVALDDDEERDRCFNAFRELRRRIDSVGVPEDVRRRERGRVGREYRAGEQARTQDTSRDEGTT
jgi:hypothetical protein